MKRDKAVIIRYQDAHGLSDGKVFYNGVKAYLIQLSIDPPFKALIRIENTGVTQWVDLKDLQEISEYGYYLSKIRNNIEMIYCGNQSTRLWTSYLECEKEEWKNVTIFPVYKIAKLYQWLIEAYPESKNLIQIKTQETDRDLWLHLIAAPDQEKWEIKKKAIASNYSQACQLFEVDPTAVDLSSTDMVIHYSNASEEMKSLLLNQINYEYQRS